MGQQIRDEKGKVLGYFLTVTEYARLERELELARAEAGREPDDRADGDQPTIISGE